MPGNLVLILGDQLSPSISSLQQADRARDRVLIAEVSAEATYVKHHKKKIAFLFSAMRHFAEELRADGWQLDYVRLDDAENTGTLSGEVARFAERHDVRRIVLTEPGEWRLARDIDAWSAELNRPVDVLPDERFVASREEFAAWADGRKQLRMEYFYREMRRKTGLLMDGDRPIGGKWNFDAENRKAASSDLFMPAPLGIEPDGITREVLDLVGREFAGHIGDLEPFWFAVTRDDAEAAFELFVREALPRFGDFQDAMLRGEKFLYHSVVSLYINAGLLEPLAVCRRVEAAYAAGDVPLNAAEGFIRQIIGWREYVRGIYWLKMPDYACSNFFGADRPLPEFYWSGETDMACLAAAVRQTREEAYAHHIQRLMVTGNFAMLAGIEPRQVHEWYLAVYADAYEWVELPNTLGMSQFADGGLLGSKPYAAGGNYINKMSDYCGACRFDVKQKTGDSACPFNYLYWDFLARNRDKLDGNPRLGPVYRTWDRMTADKQASYRESAAEFLATLF
ncbi:cryptochrome/photolyase family protein [Nisaea acidiphila]|uniref:Cryptochrome/photolyase family protein n=1 Tax=Nisaea acidiphila TaxID=1862145 RepID=A0A9J7AT85_9PROT|nr:cryptochrome/photolyase family protein [Nisaea acidiphila]UUX48573.1 cryptochrome/photolyase family protein [Nisaea acidiphila]